MYAGDRKDIPEWLRNNHDWQNPVDVKNLEVKVYIHFLAGIKTRIQGGLIIQKMVHIEYECRCSLCVLRLSTIGWT